MGQTFPLTNIFQRGWNHQPVITIDSYVLRILKPALIHQLWVSWRSVRNSPPLVAHWYSLRFLKVSGEVAFTAWFRILLVKGWSTHSLSFGRETGWQNVSFNQGWFIIEFAHFVSFIWVWFTNHRSTLDIAAGFRVPSSMRWSPNGLIQNKLWCFIKSWKNDWD